MEKLSKHWRPEQRSDKCRHLSAAGSSGIIVRGMLVMLIRSRSVSTSDTGFLTPHRVLTGPHKAAVCSYDQLFMISYDQVCVMDGGESSRESSLA